VERHCETRRVGKNGIKGLNGEISPESVVFRLSTIYYILSGKEIPPIKVGFYGKKYNKNYHIKCHKFLLKFTTLNVGITISIEAQVFTTVIEEKNDEA